MKSIILPYFGEVSIPLDVDYEGEIIDAAGRSISLDLNPPWEEAAVLVGKAELEKVKPYLFKLPEKIALADTFLQEEGLSHQWIREYVGWYRESLQEENQRNNTPTPDTSDRELLSEIKLDRIGIYPDPASPYFVVFDFTPNRELMHSLVVLKFTYEGALFDVSIES